MNRQYEREVSAVLAKYSRNDYKNRFQNQSNNRCGSPNLGRSPNRKIRSPYNNPYNNNDPSKKTKSRPPRLLLDREEDVHVLAVDLAERISHDDVISKIYRHLNDKTLIKIQKELLLLALNDGLRKLTRNNIMKYDEAYKILQHHVLLGLMEREEYFDRLDDNLLSALVACRIDTKTVFTTQRRFRSIRPLLQVV